MGRWGRNGRRKLLALAVLLFASASIARAEQAEERSAVHDILARHGNLSPEVQALGGAAYKTNCAACHDTGANRAPPVTLIGQLAPEAILRTLTSGAMKEQGAALTVQERSAVAEVLAGRPLGSGGTVPPPKMCARRTAWFDLSQPPPLAGWGLDAGNAHAIPEKVAGITPANASRLKLKWALAFPGALHARSQPTIAGNALFIGGDDGMVYAVDPASGCVHWTFAAAGPVRMGIVADSWKAGTRVHPRVYFGDILGNGYALEAATGRLVWQRKLDEHLNTTLTGSPALHEGKLYWPISSLEEPAAASPAHECCTFRGSVVALESATGAETWRAWMVDEPKELGTNAHGARKFGPSGVAIWSTPLVDPARGKLYVATGDNYSSPATAMSDAIVAVDLATGRIDWASQVTKGDAWNVSCGWAAGGNCPDENGPDHDFGAASIMAKGADGRDYLLAGQKSGEVYAFDPDSGKPVWTRRLGRGGTFGGVHFGIAAMKGQFYVPIADFEDGGKSTFPRQPGIHVVDIATGKDVWKVIAEDLCAGKRFCAPGYGAAITVTDRLVLAGAMDGHLRIFNAETGTLLWDENTDRAYTAQNGTQAHGGSHSGGTAPVAWNGMLFSNSGYGGLGKMPGNVLLAWSVK